MLLDTGWLPATPCPPVVHSQGCWGPWLVLPSSLQGHWAIPLTVGCPGFNYYLSSCYCIWDGPPAVFVKCLELIKFIQFSRTSPDCDPVKNHFFCLAYLPPIFTFLNLNISCFFFPVQKLSEYKLKKFTGSMQVEMCSNLHRYTYLLKLGLVKYLDTVTHNLVYDFSSFSPSTPSLRPPPSSLWSCFYLYITINKELLSCTTPGHFWHCTF